MEIAGGPVMLKLLATIVCSAFLLIAARGLQPNSPWFGTWSLKLTEPGEKPETLIYSDAGGGAMRMVAVEDDNMIVTHFDGKVAEDTRPGADRKLALAIKLTSPTSYSWVGYRDGKPGLRGHNVLAADFQSFREDIWLIADPKKTHVSIYERK